MALDTRRSIKIPILIAALAVLLTLALLYAWTSITSENLWLSNTVPPSGWLMGTGVAAFILIVAVLVLFTVMQVRERLEARRQSRFLDSVTHELKSPLASLKLCLDTLERRELERPQREALHEMMRDDIDRLATFIDDILESSRIMHGAGGRTLTQVQLLPLADSVARRVRRRYRVADGEVDLSGVSPDIWLVTDRTALDMVLKNLLDNAVKYSDSPVAVSVRAEHVDTERVRIAVVDRGIGIPQNQLRKVFDRFYRVDTEEVRSRKGTGLGLYVVDSLVQSLGGRLVASSEGAGAGTTMSFELPALPLRRSPGGGHEAPSAA